MSHVVAIDVELRDLDAIKLAAKRLGLVFVENQKTYRWWGTSVGDYPLPKGMTAADLGKCEHAITLAADHPQAQHAYEIGVVKRKDGQGWTLVYDFFGPGHALKQVIGEDLGPFKQAYGVEVARKELEMDGWMVNEVLSENGDIELEATK